VDRLAIERRHWAAGIARLAGVDEAGVGSLAGPVVAAAVVLSPSDPVTEADDSKALERGERERLDGEIRRRALAVSVGEASLAEIATFNVYHAGLLAMRRAVLGLEPAAEMLLVDARTIPDVGVPQEGYVKGDARSCSIGAASIVAKVHRDGLMRELAVAVPGYGFDRHAGYATPEHLDALRTLGPSPVHRAGWQALAEHAGAWSAPYYRLRDGLRGARTPQELATWASRVKEELAGLRPFEAQKLRVLGRRRGVPGLAGARRRSTPADDPPLPLE
jgi:ribonuclease HII